MRGLAPQSVQPAPWRHAGHEAARAAPACAHAPRSAPRRRVLLEQPLAHHQAQIAPAPRIYNGNFVIYSSQMMEVRQTRVFREWLDGLPDKQAAARIAQRIVRLQAGLLGDAKSVGGGVMELRVDTGPGTACISS